MYRVDPLRLLEDAEEKRVLLELSGKLAGCHNFVTLLRLLAESLFPAVPFVSLALLLPESLPASEAITAVTEQGPGGSSLLLDRTSAEQLTLRHTEIFEGGESSSSPLSGDAQSPSLLCCLAPLSACEPRGTLRLSRSVPAAFTPAETSLLTAVALLIGEAVEVISLRNEVQSTRRELLWLNKRTETLLQITHAVVSKLEMKDLLEEISTSIRSVFGSQYSSLILHEPETNMLRWAAIDGPEIMPVGTSVPMDDSPIGLCLRTGKPVVLDYEHLCIFARTYSVSRSLLRAGIRSVYCIPLIIHGRNLGVLSVGHTNHDAISPEELSLLMEIAGQVAISVNNAMAYLLITQMKERLASEKDYLEKEIQDNSDFDEIIGNSQALTKVLAQVKMVAGSDCSVLILGETGTGKELIARAIHNLSTRRTRPMVKLNCAAIPTGLFESDLFGHEKGSFTGAIARKIGRLELAHQGTLFLDEVGDIPLEIQPKLLRALQEQEFERLGSSKLIHVDVRIISATNQDLQQMIAQKEYRSDLFYRLNVFPLEIPPLRERPEDISLLVRFFTEKYAHRLKRKITHIPSAGIDEAMKYPWPGNVRELEHVIQRAVVLSPGATLELDSSLFPAIRTASIHPGPVPVAEQPSSPRAEAAASANLEGTLNQMEREYILRALRETNGTIAGPRGAAARLGLKRTTLIARMRRLQIDRDDF